MKKLILLTALFAVFLAGCMPSAPRHQTRNDPAQEAPAENMETGRDPSGKLANRIANALGFDMNLFYSENVHESNNKTA